MKVLGIDFESQSEDPQTTRITEIGAVLMEALPQSPWKKLTSFQTYCHEPDYPSQTPAIVELTGITDDMLRTQGVSRLTAFNELLPLVGQADVLCAHNKAFDQTLFEATLKLVGLTVPPKRWLCTLTEVPYPDRFTCKKLSHLAWEHDVVVDRARLHRADYDVEIMLEMLGKYDLEEVLKYADEPWVFLAADIPGPWLDNGVGKAKAQKMGFTWEKIRGEERQFPKLWVKRVKESLLVKAQEAANKLDLRIRTLV